MKVFGATMSGARFERARSSAQWAGGGFRNASGAAPTLQKGTAFPTIGEFLFGGQRRVPRAPLPVVSPLEGWSRAPATGLRATWLGHSTVLLEIDGVRVLTDPVWGARVSPVSFAGPRRFHPPPATLAELPPVDVVVISHDHFDHLDYPTILALAKTGVPFVTSLGVGAHLEAWGIPPERITELDWWEHVDLPRGGVRITAAPSQHFSGRGLGSRNATLWSSFVVRGPLHAVFFSGDTGLTPAYATIRERLGPFDLAMLEVGAFHPAWGDIHLGPENALEALALLGNPRLLPVHWGTFNLAMHAWDEPADTLVKLAPARGAQLVMPRLGEPVEPARAGRIDPWWRGVGAREPVAVLPPGDGLASRALQHVLELPSD
ncbi:MAG TPA: MBL fold metallo-hydrolase [Polyangiaceae bacterium]|jgi:L-ascorbate metabolism protein UlaG (beta-lactamase superfamily)